ncbi:peptide chain release factor N(5)-glutamine methyltransferase [Rubellimicrobium rubrum]|uniref:Release factor glutamine methyltransferase n=1 Tax=Rubellimicrobium rubrum TaxID=2585369 RepID=A0A5C4N6M8_9RHOB|nr:peptide chain release factor N(5)-glutamine methyltransferase [Rubellimicrobium rubrum]TNC52769.1 peptide chain release factor N(5)-glutamine methyltransferase [Rubellimicrobium rubrum]
MTTGPEGRTVAQVLAEGVRQLRDAGVPEAAGDARRLLAHVMGIEAGRLTLVLPDGLSLAVADTYRTTLTRRANREPVSHLTGTRLFWGREFLVNRDVLDPRPETEILVAAALEKPFRSVLDLGTGSGCILLTLLAESPGSNGLGLDLSPQALAVAEANAERLGVQDRATLTQSDWYAAAEGRFDLIVSNPPYIAKAEMPALEPEVRDWEPRLALTDEGDGLAAYRAILSGAERFLAPGGRLAVEIGPTQAEAVATIGADHGLSAPEVRQDFDGRSRVCLFRVP